MTSKPMTPGSFVDLLKDWAIPYLSNSHDNVPWHNHNRNHKGEWGPVHGIGNHHTGAEDNKAGRDILWHGYGSLPGPLCHAGITQDGAVLLNGWGRVNHFGLGDDDVLKMVISEKYTGSPKPNEANTDGNRYFYGFEWMYNGLSNPETSHPKLYRTAVRLNAAICTYHEWTEKSSIGHGNWQPGKWDPGVAKGKFFDLARFQNHVEQAIKEGPKPKLPTRPKPSPPVTNKEQVTVKSGDTFYSIARKHYPNAQTSDEAVTDLVTDNPQLLQPGEKLWVPKKG